MDTTLLIALFLMFLVELTLGAVHMYAPKFRRALYFAFPAVGAAAGLWLGWNKAYSPVLTLYLSLSIGLVGLQTFRVIHRHVP